MAEDVIVADSSPAVDVKTGTESSPAPAPESATPSLSERLSKMAPSERRKWEMTKGANDLSVVPADKAEPKAAPESDPVKKQESKELTPEERSRRKRENDDRRWHEVTRENADLKARLDALEKGRTAEPSPAKPETEKTTVVTGKPKQEDFGTYEEFLEALSEFKADEKYRKNREEDDQRKAREQAEQDHQTRESNWTKRLEEGKKKYPDFEAVNWDDVILSPYMEHELKAHENGADILYYLGQHPDESKEIANASVIPNYVEIKKRDPVEAARLKGRVESLVEIRFAGISKKLSEPPTPTVKTTTSAPPKARSVAGQKSAIEDPIEAAAKAKDWVTFNKLRDAQKIAARKARG